MDLLTKRLFKLMAAGLSYDRFYINNFRGKGSRVVGSAFVGSIPIDFITREYMQNRFETIRTRASLRRLIKQAISTPERTEWDAVRVHSPRVYRFNKAMLFKRAMAFSMLRDSDRFLAFYTMSFPVGTPEDACYRIWNILLTRMRKAGYLRGYIWVCEKQVNGTCHFHMLSNTYAPIRLVNRMGAAAIQTSVERGECSWGNSSYARYNGVDVKRVKANRKTISMNSEFRVREKVCHYLSKYISKSEQTSARRLWHCSREVSALFVSATVCDDEIMNMVYSHPEVLRGKQYVIQGDGVVYVGVPIPEPLIWYYLTRANELVYSLITKHLKR